MITRSISIALGFAATFSAFAGPDFDEGSKDAGASSTSAATVSASSNVAVTKIRGATSATALVGSDPVDMYIVRTGTNPLEFRVDMNMGSGGAPAWGARLTLFKKVVVPCQDPATGGSVYLTYARPIATVVKASAAASYPILNGSSYIYGSTSVKLGSLMAPNSDYFVAVSGASELPLGSRANCSDSGTPETLFANTTGTGIYAYSASEGDLYHLIGWNGGGSTSGSYNMPTLGVYPLPASSCDIAVPVRGGPVTKAFNFEWAPAATGIVSCAGPSWPINRQFFYAWTPACSGTAVITTCGTFGGDSAIEVFDVDLCNPDYCTSVTTASIACNDQCGTGNASEVSFEVTSGREYLVLLARVGTSGASPWAGTIKFDCSAPPPSGDINGDGVVDALDLGLLLGQWGQ